MIKATRKTKSKKTIPAEPATYEALEEAVAKVRTLAETLGLKPKVVYTDDYKTEEFLDAIVDDWQLGAERKIRIEMHFGVPFNAEIRPFYSK